MIDIVKEGKIEHKITYPLFVCSICNCEFYGTEMPKDYQKIYSTPKNGYSHEYISKCPCCGSMVKHDGSKFFIKTTYIEGKENIRKYLSDQVKGQFSCLP